MVRACTISRSLSVCRRDVSEICGSVPCSEQSQEYYISIVTDKLAVCCGQRGARVICILKWHPQGFLILLFFSTLLFSI
jgi:hypothetical protein